MTCIVAVAEGGKVVMGGDSASVSDANYHMGTQAESKVWQHGPVVIGACGSFRVAQIIRWKMDLPMPNPDGEPLAYIVDAFVDAMRVALLDGGALTLWQDTGTEELTASGLLVAHAGRVFEVFEDFGVGELVEGYGAIGCGEAFAYGALVATENLDLTPKKRVKLALQAAERHSAGVRGPFTILTTS